MYATSQQTVSFFSLQNSTQFRHPAFLMTSGKFADFPYNSLSHIFCKIVYKDFSQYSAEWNIKKDTVRTTMFSLSYAHEIGRIGLENRRICQSYEIYLTVLFVIFIIVLSLLKSTYLNYS
jgi:hypothetical protein